MPNIPIIKVNGIEYDIKDGTARTQISNLSSNVNNIANNKINFPMSNGEVDYGESGQILTSTGSDSPSWTNAGTPTDEQTATALAAYIADHPEAVTTVQDGAISQQKFASDTLPYYTLIPDNYTGSDNEKIQSCLDELASTGGSIILNREYTLTGNLVCSLLTSGNNHISIIGLGESTKLNMQSYSFVGTTDDLSGGLWFYNVSFVGTGTAFDCSALIRLEFNQCYFSGFNYCFASGSGTTSQIFQSIYVNQCYFRNIVTACFYNPNNAIYDIHVNNSVMEAGGSFFITDGSNYLASLFVENCCIEGVSKIFKSSSSQSIFQCVFNNNHFEQNTSYFDLSNCPVIANMSICNNLFGENNKKPIISLPSEISINNNGTGALTVVGNTLADHTAQAYLFGFPNNPTKGNYTGIIYKNNRFNYLTDSNTYNAYLPYKFPQKVFIQYSGSNIDDFVNNFCSDLIANQPIGSENYSILWTGSAYYSLTFSKTENSVATFMLYNVNTIYIGRYASGSITNLNQVPFSSSVVLKGTKSDPDDALETGVYIVGTGLYLVMKLDSGFISQIRVKYNTDYIEYRMKNGGTWSHWYRLTGSDTGS